MENSNTTVGIFETHDGAEKAVRKLADTQFPMKQLSVIGKGYHTEEKVVGFYNAGDRMKMWGKYGAFWGMIWGLLFGGLFVTVPLFGTIIVTGYFAAMAITAIETAVVTGGLGVIGAALYSVGIPKDSALQYEEAVKADNFVVMANGTAAEVERAREILNSNGARQVHMHSCDWSGTNKKLDPKIKIAS